MEIDVKRLEQSLLKKGFVLEASHHRIFRHQYNGKFTGVLTKISHGSKTYSDGLTSAVKRQMKFSKPAELQDFISCKLSATEYNEMLIKQGQFPR